MDSRKKTILVDIDGTLFDSFKKEDRKAVETIFEGHKFVLFFDSILQEINSLDIFANSMWILKLRLFVYCLISFNNYKKVVERYKNMYVINLNRVYFSYSATLKDLEKMYDVCFITNNEFSMYSVLSRKFFCKYSKNNRARKKGLAKLCKEKEVVLVVGNNFMDDYLPAIKNDLKFMYVGKSKIASKKMKSKKVSNFIEAVACIVRWTIQYKDYL